MSSQQISQVQDTSPFPADKTYPTPILSEHLPLQPHTASHSQSRPPPQPLSAAQTQLRDHLQIYHNPIREEGPGGRALVSLYNRRGGAAADNAVRLPVDDGVVPGLLRLKVAVIVEVADVRAGRALVVVDARDDGSAVGAGISAVEGPKVCGAQQSV